MIKERDIWTSLGNIFVPITLPTFLLVTNIFCITSVYGQVPGPWQFSASALFWPLEQVRQSGFVPPDQPKRSLLQTKLDSESLRPGNNKADLMKSDGEPEENSNHECAGCHNPQILINYRKQLQEDIFVDDVSRLPKIELQFIAGKLDLGIDEKQYAEGVRGGTACVDCHQDSKGSKQRLKSVDCKECHEEVIGSISSGAHGRKAGPRAPGCLGCHDVHYGKGKNDYQKNFNGKICVDCHQTHGMDTAKQHRNLYEARMHLVMDCMLCHSGKSPGVHNIPADKGKVASCESCHRPHTILSKEKPESVDFANLGRQTTFINRDALEKYGYVIGAHRIPLVDSFILLAAIAPLGLCIAHAGVRTIRRRKVPVHRPDEYVLLHPLIERVWHWIQAICTIALITSGAVLHWPQHFPGWFDWAVKLHNWFGIATVLAFLLYLLYNLITGRISHYVPKKREIVSGVVRQIRYYVYGIFKHELHPHYPTEENKFNPLQKIAYLQFQLFILPIVLASGVLYMYPDSLRGLIDRVGGMAFLGTVHFILGGLFAAFLVAHIYLATTGETVGENFRAIITGYGIKPHHPECRG